MELISNFHNAYPSANQAIYSHVAWLTNNLVSLDNEVTLFAAGDSDTKAKLISVTEKSTSKLDISEEAKKRYDHLLLSKCYSKAKDFDIIHSHFNLLPP